MGCFLCPDFSYGPLRLRSSSMDLLPTAASGLPLQSLDLLCCCWATPQPCGHPARRLPCPRCPLPLYHSAYLTAWPYLNIRAIPLHHREIQPALRPGFWPSYWCTAVHQVLCLRLCRSTAWRSRALAGPTMSGGSPMSYTSCWLVSSYRHPYDLRIVRGACLWSNTGPVVG